MIQLNLLPDVKLEYIRAQRSRGLIISVSFLVTAIAVALLSILFIYSNLQKKHLSDLSNDIKSQSERLKKQPQIGKILTVQNQLKSLTALHDDKPAASRVFDYLNQVTPAEVDITSFNIDFTLQTATIIGTSNTLASVNKYVDTIKFTNYKTDDKDTDNTKKGSPAFNNVVLSNFGLNSNATAAPNTQPASFTITLAYNEAIFDITQTAKLTVPNQVTTRSEINQPTDLFRAAPAPTNTTSGGRN